MSSVARMRSVFNGLFQRTNVRNTKSLQNRQECVLGKLLGVSWMSNLTCIVRKNRNRTTTATHYKYKHNEAHAEAGNSMESKLLKELDSSRLQISNNKLTIDKKETDDLDAVLNLDHFNFSTSLSTSEEWKSKFVKSMLVYPQFIDAEEEKILMKEIEPFISRLHYEEAHWDDAIHSYRETERSVWNKSNNVIIDRIRATGFPPHVRQLKLVHVLDLAKKGVIKPHIDSVRFCGNTIAGLSLLSDCIMRLRHEIQKDFYCDVLLPQRSLYVMNDFVRFEFTHEVLAECDSKFKSNTVPRDRRISIICRNEPEQTVGPVFKPIDPSESAPQ